MGIPFNKDALGMIDTLDPGFKLPLLKEYFTNFAEFSYESLSRITGPLHPHIQDYLRKISLDESHQEIKGYGDNGINGPDDGVYEYWDENILFIFCPLFGTVLEKRGINDELLYSRKIEVDGDKQLHQIADGSTVTKLSIGKNGFASYSIVEGEGIVRYNSYTGLDGHPVEFRTKQHSEMSDQEQISNATEYTWLKFKGRFAVFQKTRLEKEWSYLVGDLSFDELESGLYRIDLNIDSLNPLHFH